MACSRGRLVHGAFYQAIEKYDMKSLVRDAAKKRILSDVEKNEVEQQRSRHLMCECLINLILCSGARGQQQFADFVQDFSRRAYEQTNRQLAGFRPAYAMATNATVNDVGCSHAGKELPQLSQDSSHSGGSTSPMELDTKPVVSLTNYEIMAWEKFDMIM